jgi:hypothetical protein
MKFVDDDYLVAEENWQSSKANRQILDWMRSFGYNVVFTHRR